MLSREMTVRNSASESMIGGDPPASRMSAARGEIGEVPARHPGRRTGADA
jgi:hypothetical protein